MTLAEAHPRRRHQQEQGARHPQHAVHGWLRHPRRTPQDLRPGARPAGAQPCRARPDRRHPGSHAPYLDALSLATDATAWLGLRRRRRDRRGRPPRAPHRHGHRRTRRPPLPPHLGRPRQGPAGHPARRRARADAEWRPPVGTRECPDGIAGPGRSARRTRRVPAPGLRHRPRRDARGRQCDRGGAGEDQRRRGHRGRGRLPAPRAGGGVRHGGGHVPGARRWPRTAPGWPPRPPS